MKTIQIGTLDKPVSRINLGTWAIGGGPAWGRDPAKQAEEECKSIATICACPEVGINMIDTAPGYNFGNSERIVGKALRQIGRENICIVTKFGVVWDRKGALFNKVGDTQLYKNLSRGSVLHEIDQSLERLGTDYIDVYMSHWQSVEPYYTPIQETMELLNELKAQGRIRAIGAANVTPQQVEEYLKYGSLDIVQAKYSILDRGVEQDLLPLCRAHHIALQAYSPLEMGLLSGALPRDYKPVGAQIPRSGSSRRICLGSLTFSTSSGRCAPNTPAPPPTWCWPGSLARTSMCCCSAAPPNRNRFAPTPGPPMSISARTMQR